MNHLYRPPTPTLSESDKNSLNRAISVTFSKHGTHFGLRSGFSYYIMSPPSREHHLSASHGDMLSPSVCSTLGILTSTHYDNKKMEYIKCKIHVN